MKISYKCWRCKKEFWYDEEMEAKFDEENKIRGIDPEHPTSQIVCDDCFKKYQGN